MFRILLIVVLLFYLLYKLGLFRIFVSSVNDGYREQGNINRRPPGSNVDVDKTPEGKPKTKFKGGEYVDYEEIK